MTHSPDEQSDAASGPDDGRPDAAPSFTAASDGPREARPREKVGIVGPGRAGTALGLALAAAGYPVVAVGVRSPWHRSRAVNLFPDAWVGGAAEVAGRAEVLLVAVPDDAIGPVVMDLAAAGAVGPGRTLVHLSGRHGLGVLAAGGDVGAARIALHPIMTLPGIIEDSALLAGVPFGITADPVAEGLARRLVTDVGGIALPVADDRRDLYHASLVLGGNFLTTLVAAAGEVLAAAGVPDPAAALGPLLRASLANTLTDGWSASTGPVRRGDLGTVVAHLTALDRLDPRIAAVYRRLAIFTAEELERVGLLDPAVVARLREAVPDELGDRPGKARRGPAAVRAGGDGGHTPDGNVPPAPSR
ncbi:MULTISPECIES: Rossmann-like and DUF2520 domain-containing protein [unclassified Frankia]